jgi:CRISPR-associated protein Cas5t
MALTKAIHARLEGYTASFRYPLTVSGTRISTPQPAYSTILGVIGACAGRQVGPQDTRIAFVFRCRGYDTELERTSRWQYKRGVLKPQVSGLQSSGILIYPKLDLYLTNLQLKQAFQNPVSSPTLGRSQDLAWISAVGEVNLQSRTEGNLGPTLAPGEFGVPGLPVRLPEWIDNFTFGVPRSIGPLGLYRAMLPYFQGRQDPYASGPSLFHPSDAAGKSDVVHLHEWPSVA